MGERIWRDGEENSQSTQPRCTEWVQMSSGDILQLHNNNEWDKGIREHEERSGIITKLWESVGINVDQ